MAANLLCQRVSRLRCLQGLTKEVANARRVHVKQKDESGDLEGKKELLRDEETPLPVNYTLRYNPNSYKNSEEEERRPSSRQLSSSKNTLLQLAFGENPDPKVSSESNQNSKKYIQPDIVGDTRAYIQCRPEYAAMTLDLTWRPQPIEWEQALSLLRKVSVLRGSMKPCDVAQFLEDLSCLNKEKITLIRRDPRFIMLLRYSVEHLSNFTELQLLQVLQSFVWLDMPWDHSLLGQYEAEMIRRVSQMSLDQLLLAGDLWRSIGRQVPEFLQHLFESVQPKLMQMDVAELVQLLYIIGEGRYCPLELTQPVEQLIMRHLQQLEPEEIGAVCLGLFKSQTSVSEFSVRRIVDKAVSFADEMSDLAIVNVMKFLRFNYCYHGLWLDTMAREVPQRAHRMGVKGLMHVALTCSAMHYHNNNILLAIAERIPSLAHHCRCKDSSKLLWAFGTLGFPPAKNPQFYLVLTEAMRQKKNEFERYPQQLLTGLLGLAFVSQFPEDLIALALSPEFVNLALKYTKLDLKKDLFTLDGIVALELPQWMGPRLSSELREETAEIIWNFAQSALCQKPEVQEAESALKDLLGGEMFVRKTMILPHTRSINLEVHFDSTQQPIPVNPASHTTELSPGKESSSKMSSDMGSENTCNAHVTITDELLAQLIKSKRSTEPLTPTPVVKPALLKSVEPDECATPKTSLVLTDDMIESLTKPVTRGSNQKDTKDTVKVAVQVYSRNHYCCHSTQLQGLHVIKRRQLELAGYRVVELHYHEWFPMMSKSRTEKLAYLHSKIQDALP